MNLLSRTFLCIVFTIAGTSSIFAQAPVREPSALTILTIATRAMGLNSSFGKSPVCRAEGHALYLSRNGTFKWVNDNREFRYENTIDGKTEVYVSGHGGPAVIFAGRTRSLPPHASMADLPSHIAGFLLSDYLDNPQYQIKLGTPESVAGKQVDIVQIADFGSRLKSTFIQIWHFDHETGMPFIVEYKVPTHADASILMRYRDQFSSFQIVKGILVPMHIDRYLDDRLIASFDIDQINFGGSSFSSEFELAGGGQ